MLKPSTDFNRFQRKKRARVMKSGSICPSRTLGWTAPSPIVTDIVETPPTMAPTCYDGTACCSSATASGASGHSPRLPDSAHDPDSHGTTSQNKTSPLSIQQERERATRREQARKLRNVGQHPASVTSEATNEGVDMFQWSVDPVFIALEFCDILIEWQTSDAFLGVQSF